MGGRCGTVWSVCLCSEACAGRGGARDGAVVGRAASARHKHVDMRARRCASAAQRGPRRWQRGGGFGGLVSSPGGTDFILNGQ